ncbi:MULTISPECIES: O-antigen ligase [unclassified Herbaspirillum]|uniref:O-antigen ligase family protein n=1 Tax=unclassified Herbaspirillum TaxID=2624150 RepID=UPI001154F6F6|nr:MULTISPECIES: O-antigen ligase family protein [unclassified Herbaspirillum]MBB5391420.1 O-antigen ligase [Herbaspirillum sp. SJZ102]TQK12895.1 O-antigen ligase [Herbaspirillum sp. SJZ130]TQK14899.1 O-antigen ligase [Herbaspirillum sp. SJZ106]
MKNQILSFRWIVFIILVTSSSLLLIGRKAGNLGFYGLLLMAFISLALRTRHDGMGFKQFISKFWLLHLAMAGMMLAVLLNQLISQDFVARSLDYPSRMGLFVLIAWACLHCTPQMYRWFQWSYVAAALMCTVKMYIITDGGTTRGEYVDFMPIIEFADMTLLMGFFSLVSIKYTSGSYGVRCVSNLLKILAFIGSLYAAYVSGTRGTWLAIPFLAAIAATIMFNRFELWKKALFTLCIVAVLIILFCLSPQVQQRIHAAQQDIATYSKDNTSDTSVGTRFGLWKTSFALFLDHPLIGIGRENFQSTLQGLGREGKISPVIARQIHSHNEVFYNMATLGSFGLAGLLALYLVPGIYFARKLRSTDHELQAVGAMGLMMCVGFIVFGLTDVTFMWGASDNFYAIFTAILFSHIYRRKQELALCTD